MKTRFLICIILSILTQTVHAQLSFTETTKQPYVPTWETYEFMKYGTVGASLYTGTVNYSVPIFTYKDADFEYSISVDYATNGLKVNHKSGPLGHGWSLSSPGMITREIHGIPDDKSRTINKDGAIETQISGFNSQNLCNNEYSAVIDMTSDQLYVYSGANSYSFFETKPDIYHFNFLGFTGSFRRTVSKSGVVSYMFFDCSSSSKSLKVEDFSDNSRLTLSDGNGYKYVFFWGERSRNYYSGIESEREDTYRQWNLHQVIAPNGRKMDFYFSKDLNIYPITSERDYTYNAKLSYEYYYYPQFNIMKDNRSVQPEKSQVDRTKLEHIYFADGTHADIEYEQGLKELYYSSILTKSSDSGLSYRVKSICIYSPAGKIIKKASFSYKVLDATQMTVLDKINISGQGVFGFEYNSPAGYPALATPASDHWGYYNGSSERFRTNVFDYVSFDSLYNESYPDSVKKGPNFAAALSGTLCKIKYPTGGYSTLAYEGHDCSKKVVRTSDTEFLPLLTDLTNNEKVGGVRIKQIITYQQDSSVVDTVRYEYLELV